MVSIMNSLPISTQPASDPSSFFAVVETLESTEPPVTNIEELRSHGDLSLGSDDTGVSSELDVSLRDNSADYISGEINREMDEALKNMEDRTVSGYQSSSSVCDSSLQKHGSRSIELVSRSSGLGFQPGEMVWGKVKSHPWWPGHLFNEAFASAAVRRSRRDGHVLVAFFGDSSYGWFDSEELIPFEPHYAEKSTQTSSRNFMKAVEEAVDEASRRRALGLACCCRNSNNFRPTNVPGYFAVDVAGYDSGGVYSAKQIEDARESFRPVETLSFIRRMALTPRDGDQGNIDLIKMLATVLAYRRAVCEEFDETYAEAFGVEVVRPSRDSSGQLVQPPARISRAPLSGPLVIAEDLGDGASRNFKPVKSKDSSKKDKYLFKRRGESVQQRPILKQKQKVYVGQAKSSSYSSTPVEIKRDSGHVVIPSGGYLFQKSAPFIDEKQPVQQAEHEQREIKDHGKTVQAREETGQVTGSGSRKVVGSKLGLVDGNVGQTGVDFPARQSTSNVGVVGSRETSFGLRGDDAAGSASSDMEKAEVSTDYSVNATGQLVPETLKGDNVVVADFGEFEKVEISGVYETNLVDVPADVIIESGEQGQRVIEGSVSFSKSARALLSPVSNLSGDVPRRIVTDDDGSVTPVVAKKVKARAPKQPLTDSGTENTVDQEKKREKRKKKDGDSGLETRLVHPPKRQKFDKNGELVKVDGESKKGSYVHRDHFQTDSAKDRDFSVSTKIDAAGKIEPPQLTDFLSDLLALALDPFHGSKRNCPAAVRKTFLKFRSLAYQKSLVLSPASELDDVEHVASRFNSSSVPPEAGAEIPTSGGGAEGRATGSVQKKLKPGKPILKSSIHEKLARKRSHSDRQDEISGKRQKKLNELKSIALAKKSGQKMQPEPSQKGLQEVQRGERKEMGTPAVQARSVKLDSGRKPEPSPVKAQPVILIMKFQKGTALPSISQLKAMFIRFGPLDHSRTRVFYDSGTCKVVFKDKPDAKAAYDYASRNNLFGQTRVVYYLREIQVAQPEPPEPSIRRVDGGGSVSREARPALQYQQRSALQLKSCLKKPSSDVAAAVSGSTSVVKESQRVKFLLGGEERNRGEKFVNLSSNKNASSGSPPPPPPPPPPPAPTSFGLDINKNVKMVHPPPLPLPNSYHNSSAATEIAAKFSTKSNFSEVAGKKSIDISHQFMSLLVRMNDIVSDVRDALGYVPYHPL